MNQKQPLPSFVNYDPNNTAGGKKRNATQLSQATSSSNTSTQSYNQVDHPLKKKKESKNDEWFVKTNIMVKMKLYVYCNHQFNNCNMTPKQNGVYQIWNFPK